MRETIIETGAMTRFDNAVDEVVGAGRNLSGFVLAYGQAGRGKSVAADRYHIQRGGAYVRVWQGWSQTSFLQRLLFEVRGKNMDMPRHTGNRCKELIVSLLEENRQPIFIDEADRLKIDRIEDLRDIHEMTGAPVILIGEEGIFGLLSERRPHITLGSGHVRHAGGRAGSAAGAGLRDYPENRGRLPAGTNPVPAARKIRQGGRQFHR